MTMSFGPPFLYVSLPDFMMLGSKGILPPADDPQPGSRVQTRPTAAEPVGFASDPSVSRNHGPR